MYEVTYIIRESGVKVRKVFPSKYEADKTVRRINKGRRCILVSYFKIA